MKFSARDLLQKLRNYTLLSDQPKPLLTADGSHTLESERFQQTYHSRHGAVQESEHVFLKTGLQYWLEHNKVVGAVCIFEMGFGTGLNASLCWRWANLHQLPIHMESLEAYPIDIKTAAELNYTSIIPNYLQLHQSPWNEFVKYSEFFSLFKSSGILEDYVPDEEKKFHLIFFDAFAPGSQPELWTQEVFEKCFQLLEIGGVLTTYCSKGDVRRAMIAAGFQVEKIPGPPGKREILRAIKI